MLALAPGREHDGSDAVRPYTSITDEILLRSSEEESDDNESTGYFEILCKRYDEWGVKESVETHFLFTRTNHSYHPPGAVSTFIHTLQPGQHLKFKCKQNKYDAFDHTFMYICNSASLLYYFVIAGTVNSRCEGRIGYPFPAAVRTVTMIAVGVGIAPMIQTIRSILRDAKEWERDRNGENGDTRVQDNLPSMQVVLLYGVVHPTFFSYTIELLAYVVYILIDITPHACMCNRSLYACRRTIYFRFYKPTCIFDMSSSDTYENL